MNKNVFDDLPDLALLTLCVYAEARGEGLDGMCGVANVVMNRVGKPRWWGYTVHSVILKPQQFSPFTETDPQYKMLVQLAEDYDLARKTNITLRTCEWIARGVMEHQLFSNVGPATHFHSVRVKPAWASSKQMTKLITVGHHAFYVEQ